MVRRHCQELRLLHRARNLVDGLAGRQETLGKALNPLVADGDGGRQDQSRPVEAARDFQPQEGVPRSGWGNHVQVVVLRVMFQFVQNLLLIASEGVLEDYLGRKMLQ